MPTPSELLVHPTRNNLFRWVRSGGIDRPNESDDFPKVVRGFDGETHLRHSRMHGAILDAFKTRFFQVRRAQRHEPEQHIVSITPEPDALSQRRAEAAAASAAMTFVAARQPEIFDELVLLRKLGVILIGTMQVPSRHQIERRCRVSCLATLLFLARSFLFLHLRIFFVGGRMFGGRLFCCLGYP